MSPCDPVKKMAGAEKTNKAMIAPWAPRRLNNVLFSARANDPGTGSYSEQSLRLSPSRLDFFPPEEARSVWSVGSL